MKFRHNLGAGIQSGMIGLVGFTDRTGYFGRNAGKWPVRFYSQ
jgi:hypothetical protein